MLIVSNSLVSNLSCYSEIWRKFFINHKALNFGTVGDKAHNVLWRLINVYLSSNLDLKYVFIICKANNIDQYFPLSVARTIISTGLTFQMKCHKFEDVIYHFYRANINSQGHKELSALLSDCPSLNV